VFALVAASAGSAAADPPGTTVGVSLTDFGYACEYIDSSFEAIPVSATGVPDPGTKIEALGLSVREYRPVDAGTGNYYPFDTTIEVAEWFSHLSGQNQIRDEPLSFAMRTDEEFATSEKSHYWNTVLTGEDPDPGSWFMVGAWVDGSAVQRGRKGGGNTWASDREQVFLRCDPNATFVPDGSPWEDWNWPDEP
jgi:hypothetical protein